MGHEARCGSLSALEAWADSSCSGRIVADQDITPVLGLVAGPAYYRRAHDRVDR